MGSFIEINDTLRINRAQGFPAELVLATHLKTPYKLESISDMVFTFQAKPDIRLYHIPPVRVFLVEELEGKWIYWGLCLIESIQQDYLKKQTGGTFRITKINTPQEMKQAFSLIDTRPELNYFS